MKERNDEELTEALRAVDPAGGNDLDTWAKSEAGKRVYARILERQDKEPRAASAGTTVFRPRLVAAAVIVVIAVVVVSVVLGTRESAEQMVESVVTTGAESTGTSVVASADGVDQLVALDGILWAAETLQGDTTPEGPYFPPDDAAGYVGRAEALGITLPSERDALLTPGSVTRGTYALWVWRAFADHLPQVREVDIADLDTVAEDVRRAAIGVTGAGILDVRADGRFEADQPLT
ncbi:MAG: hypothetical protein JXA57_10650, partial [Armatimonadetes bacterium]|nr:hypothetical protein [Armatimonadota bacterium]